MATFMLDQIHLGWTPRGEIALRDHLTRYKGTSVSSRDCSHSCAVFRIWSFVLVHSRVFGVRGGQAEGIGGLSVPLRPSVEVSLKSGVEVMRCNPSRGLTPRLEVINSRVSSS